MVLLNVVVRRTYIAIFFARSRHNSHVFALLANDFAENKKAPGLVDKTAIYIRIVLNHSGTQRIQNRSRARQQQCSETITINNVIENRAQLGAQDDIILSNTKKLLSLTNDSDIIGEILLTLEFSMIIKLSKECDNYLSLSQDNPYRYQLTSKTVGSLPDRIILLSDKELCRFIAVMQEQLNECTLKDIPKDADRRLECLYRFMHDFMKLEVLCLVMLAVAEFQHEILDGQILRAVEQNPRASVRRNANQLEVSKPLVWRVLKENFLHPYHFQKVQSLQHQDYPLRMEVRQLMLDFHHRNIDFVRTILFIGEATFT
ncbi:hypothetical protein NQ318_011897 [Aromia moschata]|uniref:Uncharacterized protein n=1 Tax=Aromia moschata TaxID=1265417 RepID=A0AAV8Y972_9CUCU|nr:hypothetical protein NQ318_011897 [Aromia moschata]